MHTIGKKSRNSASFGVTVAALFLLLSVPVLTKAESHTKSLYERLGGYGAISAVVNDSPRSSSPIRRSGLFSRGWVRIPGSRSSRRTSILSATSRVGRARSSAEMPKPVHAGLGITEEEFNVVVNHLVDTLDKFKVPAKEKEELLTIIGKLKPDIVEENPPK